MEPTLFDFFCKLHIFSGIYSLIHVKLPHLWQNTYKNGQNWPYLSLRFLHQHASLFLSNFCIFNLFYEIFSINDELNFYLILLLRFLILIWQKIWWPNSKIFREKIKPCYRLSEVDLSLKSTALKDQAPQKK